MENCFIERDETLNVSSYVAVVPEVLQCVPIDLDEVVVQPAENHFDRSLKDVKFD